MKTQSYKNEINGDEIEPGISHTEDAVDREEAGSAGALLNALQVSLQHIAASKAAGHSSGYTLQATNLVREAWSRHMDSYSYPHFEDRAQFFTTAAEAMRRILVSKARRKLDDHPASSAENRGAREVEILAPVANNDELLPVNEALDSLAACDPRKAELVKLRVFAGLSLEDAAGVLGISVPVAITEWNFARAWLCSKVAWAGRVAPQPTVQEVYLSADQPGSERDDTWTRDPSGSWRDETWTR